MEATLICCTVVGVFCMNNHSTHKMQPEDFYGILVLVFLSGYRYEVGSDYTRYLNAYHFAANRFSDLHLLFNAETLWRYSFEVGYETLSVLVSRLFSNEYAIFWVIAVILYIPLIIYCRKKTNDANVAFATYILFGFWGLSLNIMKQAVSMMLVLIIYELIKNKKYILSAFFAVLALSFHTSSIIVIGAIIAVHFLKRVVYIPSKKNLRLFVLIGIALRLSVLILYSPLSRFRLLSKYLTYLNSENSDINRTFIWIGALIETIIIIAIVYIAIDNIPRLKHRCNDIEEIISLIMVGIPFSILGVSHRLWICNRFAKYFFLFVIVLIPALMGKEYINGRKTYLFRSDKRLFFWLGMIIWHLLYSVLMLDNNFFSINSYVQAGG